MNFSIHKFLFSRTCNFEYNMSQCRKSYLRRVWKKRKVLNDLLNTGLSEPGVPWPGNPRFLQISSPYPYTMTLSQSGGEDYAHLITTWPFKFSDHPTALKYETSLGQKIPAIGIHLLLHLLLKRIPAVHSSKVFKKEKVAIFFFCIFL